MEPIRITRRLDRPHSLCSSTNRNQAPTSMRASRTRIACGSPTQRGQSSRRHTTRRSTWRATCSLAEPRAISAGPDREADRAVEAIRRHRPRFVPARSPRSSATRTVATVATCRRSPRLALRPVRRPQQHRRVGLGGPRRRAQERVRVRRGRGAEQHVAFPLFYHARLDARDACGERLA
jgi:hypothetical protein